jgi:hypothetical protein
MLPLHSFNRLARDPHAETELKQVAADRAGMKLL